MRSSTICRGNNQEKPLMAGRSLTIMFILLCWMLLFVLNPSGSLAQNSANHPSPILDKNKSNALKNNNQLFDINDIKPLEKIRFNLMVLGYIALAAVLLSAMAAAWIYWKKRKGSIPEYAAMVSPEEKALGLLAELSRRGGDADIKAFYFSLSLILRCYIKDRFGLDAPEMTTEELLPRIPDIKLDNGLAQGVRDFVLASDPVKFAKQTVDRTTMERHLEFVKTFVLQTTPGVEDNQTADVRTLTLNTKL